VSTVRTVKAIDELKGKTVVIARRGWAIGVLYGVVMETREGLKLDETTTVIQGDGGAYWTHKVFVPVSNTSSDSILFLAEIAPGQPPPAELLDQAFNALHRTR